MVCRPACACRSSHGVRSKRRGRVDYRGQRVSGVKAHFATTICDEKKTKEGLLGEFEALWQLSRDGFNQERVFQRARALALSALVCLGRRTVTGLVTTSGCQFRDWSADYRLFSQERFDGQHLFGVVRRGLLDNLPERSPLVVAMDDSLLRKTGAKSAGVSYRRDPLGPPFHVNFVRAQRVLQLSAALPSGPIPSSARMIPIDFKHIPTAKKPRHDAPPEAWQQYRQAKKELNISLKGVERLRVLRDELDGDPGGEERSIWTVVDGRFTNGTVLKKLPERTVLIGRVRKDTKLYHLPISEDQATLGRRRLYGDRAPTPEDLRRDSSVRWELINVWAAGKEHSFKIKTLAPLLWRPATAKHKLRLLVIAPLAYRPRKGSRLLYRQPAYLICTDTDISIQEVLQAYIWRWDIEVNFRDEKSLLGVGQAQVRKESSVEKVPELIIATYAMLLLAANKAFGTRGLPDTLPPPKWRRHQKSGRPSTQSLINQMRVELWGKALGVDNSYGFLNTMNTNTNPQKIEPLLSSAALCAIA